MMTLPDTITLDQSGPWNNGIEGVLHIPQNFSIWDIFVFAHGLIEYE